MNIRFYALCIALSTLTAQAAQMRPAHQPTVIHHHHGEPKRSSTIKNALIITGVCAVGYGIYDYFFSHGRKLNALLKGMSQLKQQLFETKDEIKTTIVEDGQATRNHVTQDGAVTREMLQKLLESNERTRKSNKRLAKRLDALQQQQQLINERRDQELQDL